MELFTIYLEFYFYQTKPRKMKILSNSGNNNHDEKEVNKLDRSEENKMSPMPGIFTSAEFYWKLFYFFSKDFLLKFFKDFFLLIIPREKNPNFEKTLVSFDFNCSMLHAHLLCMWIFLMSKPSFNYIGVTFLFSKTLQNMLLNFLKLISKREKKKIEWRKKYYTVYNVTLSE